MCIYVRNNKWPAPMGDANLVRISWRTEFVLPLFYPGSPYNRVASTRVISLPCMGLNRIYCFFFFFERKSFCPGPDTTTSISFLYWNWILVTRCKSRLIAIDRNAFVSRFSPPIRLSPKSISTWNTYLYTYLMVFLLAGSTFPRSGSRPVQNVALQAYVLSGYESVII